MPWLALTVELNAAAAEAFSEALLEAGAQSITLEQAGSNWQRQRLIALLDPGTPAEVLVQAAAHAAHIEAPVFSTHDVADEDWVRRSQAQFQPFRIASRLWIGPGWLEPPAHMEATVRLDPGLAFGTGSHATTRLVLHFLAAQLRGGESVLDYGCGSGILAIAAAKLGAGHVDAVDIDPQAVETAAANASRNGVAVRCLSTEALTPQLYDIVVANILAQPLIVLAPLLAGRCAQHGRIALSGILQTQAQEVASAYAGFFAMEPPQVDEGWALVSGVRA